MHIWCLCVCVGWHPSVVVPRSGREKGRARTRCTCSCHLHCWAAFLFAVLGGCSNTILGYYFRSACHLWLPRTGPTQLLCHSYHRSNPFTPSCPHRYRAHDQPRSPPSRPCPRRRSRPRPPHRLRIPPSPAARRVRPVRPCPPSCPAQEGRRALWREGRDGRARERGGTGIYGEQGREASQRSGTRETSGWAERTIWNARSDVPTRARGGGAGKIARRRTGRQSMVMRVRSGILVEWYV